MENSKLNNKLFINCTTFEKERLNSLALELGVSLNYLCRAMLNGLYEIMKNIGKENIYFKLNKVIILDNTSENSKP